MDIGFRETIRFTQMGAYLLHAAGQHADGNGFGVADLQGENLTWVLSRFAVEMFRYPRTDEKFFVETWIEDFGRVFTTRNFKVTDEAGSILGAGCAVWCMLDMTSRKAVDLKSKEEYKHFATGIPCLIERPAKVGPLSSEPVSRHRVKYSDIDFNRHTNSMKYIEWMIDLFPMDAYLNREVKRMDVNYLNEALFGEVVDICQELTAPGQCVFDIKRGEESICRAAILFD
jgi:acyl-ACP thioesterase